MHLFGYAGFDAMDSPLNLKPFEKSRLFYNCLEDKIYFDGDEMDVSKL